MNQSTKQVVTAINECYNVTAKPEAQELMNLYSTIGEMIAKEENSSFVGELAKEITKNCIVSKGFSARNLRRMRDFYVSYFADAILLAEAKTIGWTLNTVIMDCCSSLEEMAFYIAMVQKQGLSKSELISEIVGNAFEKARKMKLLEKVAELHETTLYTVCPVSHSKKDTSNYTSTALKGNVSTSVAKVKPFLQGNSPPRWKPRIFMRKHFGRLPKFLQRSLFFQNGNEFFLISS